MCVQFICSLRLHGSGNSGMWSTTASLMASSHFELCITCHCIDPFLTFSSSEKCAALLRLLSFPPPTHTLCNTVQHRDPISLGLSESHSGKSSNSKAQWMLMGQAESGNTKIVNYALNITHWCLTVKECLNVDFFFSPGEWVPWGNHS